jgi:hypothetical protein
VTWTCIINGYSDGRRTHRGITEVEADDKSEAMYLIHHSFIDGFPAGVETRPDYRTLKIKREPRT